MQFVAILEVEVYRKGKPELLRNLDADLNVGVLRIDCDVQPGKLRLSPNVETRPGRNA